MNWPADCAAIIPCLNESATIGALVAAVKQQLPVVFVIDDGSTDETASIAKSSGAEVVRHKSPQGKGEALQAGWRLAHERGFTWALALDGDGQHAPSDIPSFLARAEATSAELIIGNRMPACHKMPWLRRAVNRWMSARISRLAGRELADSQCGFRLMNLDAWSALAVEAAHFEIESEVLLAFARGGRRIEFVPVEVIYNTERSKIDPMRDTMRWFRWWRRVRQCARVPAGLGSAKSLQRYNVATLQRKGK